jgi:formate dehydrogenase iron-sulfur subunit
VMPISFFLSSIVAGTALVVLIAMWVGRAWQRPFPIAQLAAVGQITFWALVVYLGFRLGDMAIRGQLASAFSGRFGLAFAVEIGLGGLLPLLLLSSAGLRTRPGVLLVASLMAVLGVVYNRLNVVIFAMDLRGRMPWVSAEAYTPAFVEWGVSLGLIAATIFLFGLGARWVPVLPRRGAGGEH